MPADVPPPAERSWWLQEALAADPGEPCPPLSADETADVVILGGGYTGMWTAHFLKELEPALDVVLLEQDICGGGPSGRNGGFCNGWWSGLDELAGVLGDGLALTTLRAGARSVGEVGSWCQRHEVDAWFQYGGDLGLATSPAQENRWRENLETAERLGVQEEYRELSPQEVQARCASPLFRGGVFVRDAAVVQPARLARGLRRVLLEQGVRIYEGSPVKRFAPGPPARAETPAGTVRAERAVVAVNAWARHWREFRRAITVRGSYIVLTAPAPERLAEMGWTGGEAIWDYRSALHYLRTTPDGRIAFGMGGMQPGLGLSIDHRFSYDERFVRIVAQDLWRMFPSFREVPLEAAWGGPIDVSGHHLPFFGTMPSGNVHYGLGYTGNGVGPCHLGGGILARMTLGIEDELTRLPLVRMEPKLFPPDPILSAGALIVNEAILRKDAAEDRGMPPNPVTDFLARLPRRLGYNLGP